MKNFLDYAAQKYYEGNPIIEDAEFDALAEEYEYTSVGHKVQDGVAHAYPMYSLKKCYVGEKEIALNGETVETPKLDGAAVSLLYIGGELKLALTRGDGKRGLDITEKMRYLVPGRLQNGAANNVIQITGEVVAYKDIPNSRNYASGALGLKSLSAFVERDLYFIAYGIQPFQFDTYIMDMNYLKQNNFNTVIHDEEHLRKFPTDGRVIRLNSNYALLNAGYTASHPKGAYALKERGEGVCTKLLSVDWQVGRTGQVSPVAILEPVMVGDAKVSRATLHNMKYINELGLELGCEVEIIRSGEIIPRVIRRV